MCLKTHEKIDASMLGILNIILRLVEPYASLLNRFGGHSTNQKDSIRWVGNWTEN